MTPDQARVARVLLIHFWRRLVLRYPTVQAPIPEWPLAQVQREIAGLYPHLLRMSGVDNVAGARFH
jgi:phenylacetic acid degradation operon negative regulatory protein